MGIVKDNQFKSIVKVVSNSSLTPRTGINSSRNNLSSKKNLTLENIESSTSLLPALNENKNMPFNPQPETLSQLLKANAKKFSKEV